MTGAARSESLSVGVIVRRAPGVTRWAPWSWRVTGLLPGAGPGGWKELARDGDTVEYHAATVPMELHRTETEAYLVALNASPPVIWVVMRPPRSADDRPEVVTVTASAYEAQDFTDNGEDVVEPVPIPAPIAAWISDFVGRHHVEEEFVKRKRKAHRDERRDEGIGDARVRQTADVYRSPASLKERDR